MNYCYVYISMYLLFFIDTVIAQSLISNDNKAINQINLEKYIRHNAWAVSTSENVEWDITASDTHFLHPNLFQLANRGMNQEEWSILTIEDIPLEPAQMLGSLHIPLVCNLSGRGSLTISYFTGKKWISAKTIDKSFVGTVDIKLNTLDSKNLSLKFIYHSNSKIEENIEVQTFFLSENDPLSIPYKIYPNPSTPYANIFVSLTDSHFKSALNQISLQLRDLKGHLLLNNTNIRSSNFYAREIQTRKLQPGVYLLEISVDKHSWTEKLIIH